MIPIKCFYCSADLPGSEYARPAHSVCAECDGILDAFIDTNNLPEDVFENTPTVAIRAIINTIRSFNKSLLEAGSLIEDNKTAENQIPIRVAGFKHPFASEIRGTSTGPVACIDGEWYSVNGDRNEIIDVRYRIPHFGHAEFHRNSGLTHIDEAHRETYRYSAMWTHKFTKQHPEIKGTPSGTGPTEEAALRDLIFRTNLESNTSF